MPLRFFHQSKFFRNNRSDRPCRRRIVQQLSQTLLRRHLLGQKQEQSASSHSNENTHPLCILLISHWFELAAIPLVKSEKDIL